MNVDRHYETFACFRSLTLFVSSCSTKFLFPTPQGHPRRTTFEFSATLPSHVWVLCFSASPPSCCHTYSSSIEFA
jgi:hypothetical protein